MNAKRTKPPTGVPVRPQSLDRMELVADFLENYPAMLRTLNIYWTQGARVWDRYNVHDLPTGQSGRHIITRRTLALQDAVRSAIQMHQTQPGVLPGCPNLELTVLTRREANGTDTVVMSDSPNEIYSHLAFIQNARGRVLVAGLGLGVVVNALCCKPTVDFVTVVEHDIDVIALVGPYYAAKYGDKFQLVQEDIWAFTPGPNEWWDSAWFDIWDTVGPDNLPDMRKLLAGPVAQHVAAVACWAQDLCEFMGME